LALVGGARHRDRKRPQASAGLRSGVHCRGRSGRWVPAEGSLDGCAEVPVTRALTRDDVQPRLLAQWLQTGRTAKLSDHARQYGALPSATSTEIIRAVSAAGLRGRGGAWFSTGRKLAAVARNGAEAAAAHVVVNGAEGEPASAKDALLLRAAPHLVL